ncbi:MAG: SDR family NAD(P)-dependent oxidoreductase [Alphaproteobacteria bacterium]|nr:SDR family NAD(P)-dependent oxidoreductase [Alphaproteobacteria bacterium]
MSGVLDGRIAVVTGASRGIGRAVALRYAAEGAHVIALARTVGALEELDDEIGKRGGSATLVPVDLNDLDKLEALGPSLYQRFGKVDIFVANAGGLGTVGPISHHEPKLWEETFRINVHANFRLIRSLEPALRLSDAGRAIIVTSGAARSNTAYWGAYAASKAALEAMALTWADELANTKVRVNLLSPGPIATRMRASAFPGEDPATLRKPEDIAGAFVDLALPGCTRHGETISLTS